MKFWNRYLHGCAQPVTWIDEPAKTNKLQYSTNLYTCIKYNVGSVLINPCTASFHSEF